MEVVLKPTIESRITDAIKQAAKEYREIDYIIVSLKEARELIYLLRLAGVYSYEDTKLPSFFHAPKHGDRFHYKGIEIRVVY